MGIRVSCREFLSCLLTEEGGGQLLLAPEKINAKSKSMVFKDVWAGSYNIILTLEMMVDLNQELVV